MTCTRRRAIAWTASLLLSAAVLGARGPQDDPDRIHVAVYRKVAPATVFVRGDNQEGSGVLIDPSGIVLTSPTACGSGSQSVTVFVKGHRQYAGRVMGRVNDKELVLVKIEARGLPSVELGDSDAARTGQLTYVLGDSFHSIKRDDQPAISMGVISGIYDVRKKQPGTFYTGKVLETSAAVNPNQDGGPLVDRNGRLLGVVTLNYEESKFTGIAVPINEIRKDIERIRKEFEGGIARKGGDAWLGAEVKAAAGGLEVSRVAANGPAEKGGLRKGDLLTKLDDDAVATEPEFLSAVGRRAAGDVVRASVVRGGTTLEFTLVLARKRVY